MVDYTLHIHMQEGGGLYLSCAVDVRLSLGHQTYNLHNTTKKKKKRKSNHVPKISSCTHFQSPSQMQTKNLKSNEMDSKADER